MQCANDVAAAHFASVAILPNQSRREIAMMAHKPRHRVNRRAIVSREHDWFAPICEHESPRILRLVFGTIKALQLEPPRRQTPDAGLVQLHQAPWRLDLRKNVQALAHPQFATGSPKKRVDVLVGIASAKSTEHDLALVGL